MAGVKGRSGRKPTAWRDVRLEARVSQAAGDRVGSLMTATKAVSIAELLAAILEKIPVEIAKRAVVAYRSREPFEQLTADQLRAVRVLEILSAGEREQLLNGDLGAMLGGLRQSPPTLSHFSLVAVTKMGELSGIEVRTLDRLQGLVRDSVSQTS